MEVSTVNNTIVTTAMEIEKKCFELTERISDYGLLVYKYYTPFLFLFGVLRNSLSLLVFLMDPKYRRKSSSYYLTALAISDIGYLLNLFMVWLGSLNKGVITSSFTCPLVMYLGQVTCFVTVYITLAFTGERFIAVNFPLRKLQLCTASNARKIILAILITSLLLFLYVWVISEVAEVKMNGKLFYVCTVSNRYHQISEKANYFDSLFTFIIPFLAITYLNVKIAIKLCRKRKNDIDNKLVSFKLKSLLGNKLARKSRNLTLAVINKRSRNIVNVIHIPIAYIDGLELIPQSEGKHCQVQHFSVTHIHRSSNFSEVRVTKTLLLVSVAFLCLNLPLHVLRCAQFIQQTARFDLDGIKLTLAFQPWAMMLFNTYFAVNFILYCMSGTGFRRSLHSLLVRLFSKNSGASTV